LQFDSECQVTAAKKSIWTFKVQPQVCFSSTMLQAAFGMCPHIVGQRISRKEPDEPFPPVA
jgi:hypothetical protein